MGSDAGSADTKEDHLWAPCVQAGAWDDGNSGTDAPEAGHPMMSEAGDGVEDAGIRRRRGRHGMAGFRGTAVKAPSQHGRKRRLRSKVAINDHDADVCLHRALLAIRLLGCFFPASGHLVEVLAHNDHSSRDELRHIAPGISVFPFSRQKTPGTALWPGQVYSPTTAARW